MIIRNIILSLFAAGTLQASLSTPGILATDTRIALVMDGKNVGTMTLKAGSQVTITQILPNDGGVMISRGDATPTRVANDVLTPESLTKAFASYTSAHTTLAEATAPVITTSNNPNSTPSTFLTSRPSSPEPDTPSAFPVANPSDFSTTIHNGQVTINHYTGPGGDVAIPNTINGLPVVNLAYGAFKDCKKLTGIIIPNNVKNIEGYVFGNCSNLTNAQISYNVSSMGGGVFAECTKLSSVTIDSGNRYFENSPEGILFDHKKSRLLFYPPCKKEANYEVPSSVTVINSCAFMDCTNLLAVTLPEKLTKIGNQGFRNCTGLKYIIIPSSVSDVEINAFQGCKGLEAVQIGKGITKIQTGAFNGCKNLERAIFQGNAPTVESDIFVGTPSSFKIYCQNGSTGFTSPTWADKPVAVLN